MIRYLVNDVHVDVNIRTSKHVTPLISAVSGGDKNVDIVRMLLENGAKVSDRTLDLQSLFYFVCFSFFFFILAHNYTTIVYFDSLFCFLRLWRALIVHQSGHTTT